MLQDGGTVTAGNSSTYGDAAAIVVLMGGDVVKSRGISPIARVVAYAQAGVDPAYMGIGPVPAVTLVVSIKFVKNADSCILWCFIDVCSQRLKNSVASGS
jgi:acetyl-CoA C-acetyltransferase